MSCKELRRAGVLARVESGELKLVDAAVMMGMSYRQSKRLAKRYREGDHDYNGRYGSRDEYKREYRAAFEQGYREGYGLESSREHLISSRSFVTISSGSNQNARATN